MPSLLSKSLESRGTTLSDASWKWFRHKNNLNAIIRMLICVVNNNYAATARTRTIAVNNLFSSPSPLIRQRGEQRGGDGTRIVGAGDGGADGDATRSGGDGFVDGL